MQQAIIDCRTGDIIYVELSPAEESKRLEEIERNKVEAQRTEKAEAKEKLLRELLELREMKANPEVFTDEEIDCKQSKVSGLLDDYRKSK